MNRSDQINPAWEQWEYEQRFSQFMGFWLGILGLLGALMFLSVALEPLWGYPLGQLLGLEADRAAGKIAWISLALAGGNTVLAGLAFLLSWQSRQALRGGDPKEPELWLQPEPGTPLSKWQRHHHDYH